MLEMVITDLDGTLVNPQGKISKEDLETLDRLGTQSIIRVIATGRSLYSAKKILNKDLPLDYLIFSSGAGVFDWKSCQVIKKAFLKNVEIIYIYEYLYELNVDFMLHLAIPDNHKFYFYESGKLNPDFKKRLNIYLPHSMPLSERPDLDFATQFVVIIPNRDNIFLKIKNDLNGFSVIRTTSPLDKKTMWIEIFPAYVSKSQTANWLCRRFKANQKDVLSIGNDYNDLDLLEWSGYSYVVDNAPEQLKQLFKVTKSNHESAFKHAVSELIQL